MSKGLTGFQWAVWNDMMFPDSAEESRANKGRTTQEMARFNRAERLSDWLGFFACEEYGSGYVIQYEDGEYSRAYTIDELEDQLVTIAEQRRTRGREATAALQEYLATRESKEPGEYSCAITYLEAGAPLFRVRENRDE